MGGCEIGELLVLVDESVREVGLELVESFFEVIVAGVQLGGEGNHVLHRAAQDGLLHRVVDALEEHLSLHRAGAHSNCALEDDCQQQNTENRSHFLEEF